MSDKQYRQVITNVINNDYDHCNNCCTINPSKHCNSRLVKVSIPDEHNKTYTKPYVYRCLTCNALNKSTRQRVIITTLIRDKYDHCGNCCGSLSWCDCHLVKIPLYATYTRGSKSYAYECLNCNAINKITSNN